MKRSMLMLAILAVMLAPIARAADEEKPGGGPRGGAGGGAGWGRHMAEELGLSDDQQAKLKTIGEEQRKVMQPLHETMQTQMKELKELVDAKAADAKLTAKMDQIKQTRDSIDTNQKKFQAQREAVLTPMQKAKSLLMMGRMGRQGMEGMGPQGGRQRRGEGKE